MKNKFEVDFLESAREFLLSIDDGSREKLIYNIDKAKSLCDPRLFKKLDTEIWEFRAESRKVQYRLLAFWDKRDGSTTLVICTHGFIKKQDKVPKQEIESARRIMKLYFEQY